MWSEQCKNIDGLFQPKILMVLPTQDWDWEKIYRIAAGLSLLRRSLGFREIFIDLMMMIWYIRYWCCSVNMSIMNLKRLKVGHCRLIQLEGKVGKLVSVTNLVNNGAVWAVTMMVVSVTNLVLGRGQKCHCVCVCGSKGQMSVASLLNGATALA